MSFPSIQDILVYIGVFGWIYAIGFLGNIDVFFNQLFGCK